MNLLTPYLSAGYPAVAVETHEEDRFIALLVRDTESTVYAVAAIGGLRQASIDPDDPSRVLWAVADPKATYPQALERVAKLDSALLVALDWHHIARNAPAYRALKDALPALKARGSCVVLVAPSWSLPVELQHDVPVLQFLLPTRTQLGEALDLVAGAVAQPVLGGTEREAALDAAAGLTLQEAESAYALSYAASGAIDPRRVEAEKMAIVRASGYLEVSPVASPDSLGGLGALRDYVEQEVVPSWHDETLRTRGVILVGVPGTGKSLAARTFGALLGCPVLRMDIGALKASHVGESEARMRSALALADAVAPAILWCDEIEKGVGGFASSAQTDSGVTLGMVGTLLTWMQEHTSQVVVVATCNDYAKLPPELTRAGRMDERFFVDLPGRGEREDIARIHIARLSPDSAADLALPGQLADLTPGWTGAEIEQAVKSAARRTRRAVDLPSLVLACSSIRPISQVRTEEVDALRKWAGVNLRSANSTETPSQEGGGPTTRRRITVAG